MRIELYPTSKSCAMECPGCNLSGSSGSVKTNHMSSSVKDAFVFLQDIVVKNNLSSVLGYNLPENAEVVEDIGVVKMDLFRQIGIVVGKMGLSSDYYHSTITRLQRLLSGQDLTKTILKCIITRPNPSVGGVDNVKELYSLLCNGFDPQGTKGIHLGLEYNMHNYDFFLKQVPIASAQRWGYYNYLKSKYSGEKVSSWESICDVGPAAVWRSHSFAHLGGGDYGITSRYITRIHEDNLDSYRAIALSIVDNPSPFEESFSLYPHGVLLNHSRIDLNNPFFWVSYEDFYKTMDSFKDFHEGFKALIADNISKIYDNDNAIPEAHQRLINPK